MSSSRIGAHLSLGLAPLARLASLALIAGCEGSGGGGGGPCRAEGSAGNLAFTFQSQRHVASCFEATAAGGSLTFTSLAPSAGRTAAVIQLTLEARDRDGGAVCPWYPGASAPLAGGCVTMLAQGQAASAADAGAVSILWTAAAGVGAGTPAPTGALLVSDWATGPGQLASVGFSPGAALTASGAGPDGGTLVPVSGTAVTLTSE